ncbi:hypothetical protein V6Z92_010291 [Aspergillus fumigatus]
MQRIFGFDTFEQCRRIHPRLIKTLRPQHLFARLFISTASFKFSCIRILPAFCMSEIPLIFQDCPNLLFRPGSYVPVRCRCIRHSGCRRESDAVLHFSETAGSAAL